MLRVTVVSDTHTVEICGALKNIVACAAGTIYISYFKPKKKTMFRPTKYIYSTRPCLIFVCVTGFCDGLEMGDNTKAAAIRSEMICHESYSM